MFLCSAVFNEFLQLNIMGVNNILKSHAMGYTLYVGLALVGVGIMVVAAPIMYVLLFCPMQVCLRKKMIYTKC